MQNHTSELHIHGTMDLLLVKGVVGAYGGNWNLVWAIPQVTFRLWSPLGSMCWFVMLDVLPHRLQGRVLR